MGNYDSKTEGPSDPFACYWFYGRITRTDAESRLRDFEMEDGLFLAREKLEFAGNYVISVCHKGNIYHYHAFKDENDEVKIQNGKPFIGLVELVEYYRDHRGGMVTRLEIPCERPPETVPIGYVGSSISRARLNALISDAMHIAARKHKLRSRFYYEQRILKVMHKYQSWYYESINRRAAEQILLKGNVYEGKFLIRKHNETSENYSQSQYVLSVCAENKIQHYEIAYAEDQYFLISKRTEPKKFGSLVQLVDYYHRTRGNLPTVLIAGSGTPRTKYDRKYLPLTEYVSQNELDREKIYKEIWIPQNKIRVLDVLGSGFFGIVYLGELIYGDLTRVKIALKALKPSPSSQTMLKELLSESKLIQNIKHPYIVEMLGISYSNNYGLMLALEFAPLGSLESFVRNHKKFEQEMILNLMYQVAEGMKYLSHVHIIHRDLAARNVLLKSTSHAKITDFGLSKLMSEENFYEARYRGKWPLKWYPPEAIRVGRFSEKSDVWSYGVTMWEALTYGGSPYANISFDALLYALDRGERLKKPKNCSLSVYSVMVSCWMRDPELRPSFHSLAKTMEKYKL